MEPWKMKRKKDFAATIIAPLACEVLLDAKL